MKRNCYMVRIQGNQFDSIEQKSVVAVGWSDWNIAEMSEQDVEEKIGAAYDSWGCVPQLRGRKLNEIKRFKNIKPGDYILVPHWNSVWLAVAKGPFLYDEDMKNCKLANQLKVSFQRDKKGNIRCPARNQLSERLSRRLHLRGATVLSLNDFEQEIEQMFHNEKYDISEVLAKRENLLEQDFKKKLLWNIRKGNVYLKSGGVGLEHLVRELFECEKFEAQVLAKDTFAGCGDADVSAVSKFQISILAQIKHHDGYTDGWGIKQLKQIRRNGEDRGFDKLMLITSGKISDKVREDAENSNVAVMDGEQLVDWIYENIGELSDDTKRRLKISDVPTVLE